jgi:hypothetical protein
MEPSGDPSATRRTIALRYDGKRFTGPHNLPYPVNRGWASANGSGYCTAFRGSMVHVYSGESWRVERFSAQDEDVLRIWGMSGGSTADDVVFISTDGALFVRRGGGWTRHVPPEPAQRLFGVHGRGLDELYVCSDGGLLLWSGDRLQLLEDRPRPIVKAVLVSSDEIYAGDNYLMHWSRASGWQRVQPTLPDPTALIEVDGVVIVATFEKGVMERQGDAFVRATPNFMCLELQQLGKSAFAMGDDQSYVRVDGRWQQLAMPECAVGQLPEVAR